MKNGIIANITKTSIKKDGKILRIGDGGIDIFGYYKRMNFILQAKYRTDKGTYVSPGDISKFAAVLMEQPKNTVGFFVSNSQYSTRSQNIANNSSVKIILCNDDNFIEEIKKTQELYSELDTDIICFEDIITEENTNIEIFGIKFNGKMKIGRIRKIRDSAKTY